MRAKAHQLHRAIIKTPEGEFIAWFSDQGLAAIDFPDSSPRKESPAKGEPPAQLTAWLALTRQALINMLAGKPAGALPPLDLSSGTPFQQGVWKILAGVPCGGTISYGAIAKALGRPGAPRAVGAACGANPIPVLVPCHRVLAANSKLGGFSGGLNWKRKLLALEGVTVQT